MLLSWNYTLELFFWIIIGAVALVSLTILLAGPKFRAKVTKLSEETLSLTGKYVNSYNQKTVTRNLNSSKIEEDDYFVEKNKQDGDSKERVSFYTRMKAYCIIFLYSIFSFFISIFGVIILYVEIYGSSGFFRETSGGIEAANPIALSFGLGLFYSGLASLYGFLSNDKNTMRLNYRAIAVLFFLSPVISDYARMIFDGLSFYVIIPLIFSGDLKLLWLKINNYGENKEKEVLDENNDVPLWWVAVGWLGMLCLLLVLGIFGPIGFVLVSATVIIVTIYINLN